MAVLGGLIAAVIGELFAVPLLNQLNVPDDVFPLALLYLRIYLAGLPVILLYNFEAAVFRSVGETKIPLIALTASGVLNVILNLFFVAALHMSVDGVAIATVLSNAVSAAILWGFLLKTDKVIRLEPKKLRIDGLCLKQILRIGVPAGILRLAQEKTHYKLAVSLHAPNDAIRDQIMPQNRVHPIAEVLSAADAFFRTTGRRVTFEYILLDGINASTREARELARLLRNKTAIVNVIPYNPAPELPFKTPSTATVKRFVSTLEEEGIQVKVRFKKGDRINAACGQLRWSLRDEKEKKDA